MKLFRSTAVLTFVVGCALLAVGIPLRQSVITMFIDNSEIVIYGEVMVIGCFISAPFASLFQLCQNFLQSTNKAGAATVSAVLEKGLLYIIVLPIMAKMFQ